MSVHTLLETTSVWTLKAWAEWAASRSWAGRQVGWVTGPHLTLGGDARMGYARPRKGRTRRMAQVGRSPKTSAGLPKPGGEGSGRQGWGLAPGPLEGSTRGCQSLGASLSSCWNSRCVCQLDSSTPGGGQGGGHSSPPGGPGRCWPGPTRGWWLPELLLGWSRRPCLLCWHPQAHPVPSGHETWWACAGTRLTWPWSEAAQVGRAAAEAGRVEGSH